MDLALYAPRVHLRVRHMLEPLRVDVSSTLFGLVGRLAGFDLVAGGVPDLPNLGHSNF
jgi:hypothetical protein